ncbi:Glyoxylate/hydroxypyruvate reductase A [wastewater metagenome]|uniref:Glyoxylate/hydroxypyruvate reductase A n=2 Tax=unclassified sequences TaxID=12908 RepID=A0A5B8RE75_9ZZZZ|nr:D-2-hydroxyacid dehydrogenase [Arhodomonas sp. KWT]QEA07329.1 glyoxylate/hydroxypyruvate reductase A [uncultured organism]
MNRALILSEDADVYHDLLRDTELPGLTLHVATDADKGRALAPECDIILGKPALVAQVLDTAERLSWVQSTFAGVDALLEDGLPRGYTLTGVKDVFGPLMSEYVLGWLIALERQFFALREQQRGHVWAERQYRGLGGRTMGIAGLGSIGQHIAGTANHFGLDVIGYKRRASDVPGVRRVYAGDEWDRFLEGLDYLVLTLPDTPETHHLVDAAALERLPAHAWVVNVGRGPLIDSDALAGALRDGRIAGAVLDVFETEPLPADSPLWDLENCYVTPHVAAESFPEDIVEIFRRNYARYRDGEALDYVIDFARGY